MINNIEKMNAKDTLEMIDFLQSNKIKGYEKIVAMLDDERQSENLTGFILEESKLFGSFAFKHTEFNVNYLNDIKKVIQISLQKEPDLEIVHNEYLKWIDLKDINPKLTEEEAKELKKELMNFLNN